MLSVFDIAPATGKPKLNGKYPVGHDANRVEIVKLWDSPHGPWRKPFDQQLSQRVHLGDSTVLDQRATRAAGQEVSMSSQPHAGLSREFIEQQRQRLLALRHRLLGGEESNLAQERAFQSQHGDEAAEEEDTAQDMAQREVDQALHDVDDHRIANIERALQKIEEGSYGLSDLSGNPIPQDRLLTTPEAILTVQEERQREGRH